MVRTKKRAYRKKSQKSKRKTKRMKLKIKNLGKRRSLKRIQYGCSSKKNMKGGGPIFQPLTDTARVFEGNSKDTYNTYMGNDTNTNETIIRDPASLESNYNFNTQ